jgi:hypothetical protein
MRSVTVCVIGRTPHFLDEAAMPARVWVWITQAMSGRTLWIT